MLFSFLFFSFYLFTNHCVSLPFFPDRPTAQQLLAHNFFRLAKDKAYLATNLVERGKQNRQEMIRNGTLPSYEDDGLAEEYEPGLMAEDTGTPGDKWDL